MNPAVHEHDALARQWKRLYASIAPELAAAEQRLRLELTSEDPFVDSLVKDAFRLGGKRLRPALVLLSRITVGAPSRAYATRLFVVPRSMPTTLLMA